MEEPRYFLELCGRGRVRVLQPARSTMRRHVPCLVDFVGLANQREQHEGNGDHLVASWPHSNITDTGGGVLAFFSEEDAVLAGWLQPDSSADLNDC